MVLLGIYVADAVVGLRRTSKNKGLWTKKKLCVTTVELEHKDMTIVEFKYIYMSIYSHVRALLTMAAAVYDNLAVVIMKSKSIDLELHLFSCLRGIAK